MKLRFFKSRAKPISYALLSALTSRIQVNLIDKTLAEKLIKSVGFRNIAIHTYGELDLNLTFMIAKHHISDFKDFIKQISDSISL